MAQHLLNSFIPLPGKTQSKLLGFFSFLLPNTPLEGGLAGPPEQRTAEIVNHQSA